MIDKTPISPVDDAQAAPRSAAVPVDVTSMDEMNVRVDTETLEEQQATLLRHLGNAHGKPVSYAALRDAGVEYPASVACELELAGAEIEHCYVSTGRGDAGARVPALRLDVQQIAEPARAHGPGPGPGPGAPGPADYERHIYVVGPTVALGRAVHDAASGTTGATRRLSASAAGAAVKVTGALTAKAGTRWLAAAVLLASAVAIVAIVIASLGGSSQHAARAGSQPGAGTHRTASRQESASSAARAGGRGGRATRPPADHLSSPSNPPHAAAQPRPTPPSPALSQAQPSTAAPSGPSAAVPAAGAAELEAQGHSLLEAERYGEATPVLRRALAATGESVGNCVQPTSEACLTYAYALYDLGHSLQLGGDPASAVPLLESRLEIDNQRPVVQAALEAARASSKTSGRR